MAGEPAEGMDDWDADVWTLEGLNLDEQEIAPGEHDADDDGIEDDDAYRERLLAPLRRLARRLRAEDEAASAEAFDRLGDDPDLADGTGEAD